MTIVKQVIIAIKGIVEGRLLIIFCWIISDANGVNPRLKSD